MLQGVMKCGMGNWIDISEQYVKSKTAAECEDHYFTFYYKSKEQNMPSEKDCIIKGPREISFPHFDESDSLKANNPPKFDNKMLEKVQITVPIDKERATLAEDRV